MEAKTKGAWVVHHMRKLDGVTSGSDFDNIYSVGKAGVLLSALARDKATVFSAEKVAAYAAAAGIKRLELPGVLQQLKDRRYIDQDGDEIQALGLTSSMVLTHTGKAFDAVAPTPVEKSVIELAERVSDKPVSRKRALEELGDTHGLSKARRTELARQIEDIGFIDAAPLDDGDAMYFNGHLFKHENADKIARVLASVTAEEDRRIREAEALLDAKACLPVTELTSILTESTFRKLHHIGMYDVNGVHNATEDVLFVTKPAAFAKFGDPFVDDALDLAKCFVACLTYGMTRSQSGRGRIAYVHTLLRKLIAGESVGPATAIGQDYSALEMKGVVATEPWGDGRYTMKLLKKDVGELALHVIVAGEAAEATLLGSAAVNHYSGPEFQRVERKKQIAPTKRQTLELLNALRSGGR